MNPLRHGGFVPVIDLFAGPGGLAEGFSRGIPDSGVRFKVLLSIEADPVAHSTLKLRAFFRKFSEGVVPGKYYDVLRGKATVEDLYNACPNQAQHADLEAWNATLGKTPRSQVNERITKALDGADPWVLIGGPPCQAYSLAGRARNKGKKGYKPDEDHRQFLYVEYLQVIADHWPAIFIMENVKGLLSANVKDERMFQNVLRDLQSPAEALDREDRPRSQGRGHKYRIATLVAQGPSEGGAVDDYVVAADKYGIPQARHRVILVGIRDDLGDVAIEPLLAVNPVTTHQAIGKLPRLRSGISREEDTAKKWLKVLKAAGNSRWLKTVSRHIDSNVSDAILDTVSRLTAPQKDRGAKFIEGDFLPDFRPEWFEDGRLEGVCQHETRQHMKKDLYRYLFLASFGKVNKYSPRLGEFPKDLLPKHKNVEAALKWGGFNDRFTVQLKDTPATTITSHIAKDGHYFIHYDPAQCRSLTLREAARLQTFPDNYFFCGPRTAGYGQVGNAVPPLLANMIAERVWLALKQSGLVE